MVNFYGFVIALGFIVMFILLRKFFIRKGQKDYAIDLIIYLILGTIIGARIFYVFYYHPQYFISNILEIFYIWQGGLSFHGGLIGAIISIYLFSKRYKIDFLELSDFIVIPAAFFLGLGRIANFINSELYGTITNVPWCVNFEDVEGCRHPVQIYDSIKNFLIFFFLIFLKTKKVKKGVISLSFVFLYSFLRFFIDFYREYDVSYFGIGAGQHLNFLTFLISGYFLYKLIKES